MGDQLLTEDVALKACTMEMRWSDPGCFRPTPSAGSGQVQCHLHREDLFDEEIQHVTHWKI